MTDFNYSEYSIEVLEGAIKNANDAIKRMSATAKRFDRNLTLHNGRGFSNEKKAYFESYLKRVPMLIECRKEEIAECKAEIASRVFDREVSQETLKEFFEALGK